jgi:hypothetical protein
VRPRLLCPCHDQQVGAFLLLHKAASMAFRDLQIATSSAN